MLSEIATQLSLFITQNVTGAPNVVVGPPSQAAPSDANAEPLVNLFFYKLSPSGFYPDATSRDPYQLRIHCMITTFGKGQVEANQAVLSEGEINLRILGSIIQKFHERPVHHIALPGGGPEAQSELQVIFAPMNIEELNQIWATQGDVAFRTSLAYEISLAPITSSLPAAPAPRVSGFETQVVPNLITDMDEPAAPSSPSIAFENNADSPEWLAETWREDDGTFVTRLAVDDPANADPQHGDATVAIKVSLPNSLTGPHTLTLQQIESTDQIVSTQTVAATGTVNLDMPKPDGKYIIFVDSRRTDTDGHLVLARSNLLTLRIASVPQPAEEDTP